MIAVLTHEAIHDFVHAPVCLALFVHGLFLAVCAAPVENVRNVKISTPTFLECAVQWQDIHSVTQLSPVTISRNFLTVSTEMLWSLSITFLPCSTYLSTSCSLTRLLSISSPGIQKVQAVAKLKASFQKPKF